MFQDRKNLKIHFVGIGGIGMSGIAEVLIRQGYDISGSDLEEGDRTTYLRSLRASVHIGHHESHIDQNVNVVVYNSAVAPDNPEILRAKALGIPVIKRAEMLAELMRTKYGIAVAGTHGKTTTSSILATIMHECQLDTTHVIGGVVQNFDGNAKLGQGPFIIVEADESDSSFLLLNPIFSIITNIDNDHLNHFQSEENIFDAFLEFSNKVPFYGYNSCNAHDEKILQLMKKTKRPCVTYGVEIECDYQAQNLEVVGRKTKYQLYIKNKASGEVELNMLGRHNVLNSLAAISVVHQIVPNIKFIIEGVKKFKGVRRRFEVLHESNGFLIIDDYAHHPTEIKETLYAAKELKKKNLVVLYEPHRFSRTKDCWKQFIECLKMPSKTILLPIYPASEKPLPGITSQNLAKEIDFSQVLDSFDEVRSVINDYTHTDTVLLTLGAGAIGGNIRRLIKDLT